MTPERVAWTDTLTRRILDNIHHRMHTPIVPLPRQIAVIQPRKQLSDVEVLNMRQKVEQKEQKKVSLRTQPPHPATFYTRCSSLSPLVRASSFCNGVSGGPSDGAGGGDRAQQAAHHAHPVTRGHHEGQTLVQELGDQGQVDGVAVGKREAAGVGRRGGGGARRRQPAIHAMRQPPGPRI
jgi:hypothetical protein